MTIETLILTLTPIVVLLATELVKKIPLNFNGISIVLIIVPILSALVAWLGTLIIGNGDFWLQAGIGLISTFVYEVIRQLKANSEQKKIKEDYA
jgi:hypothetical protein